MDRGEVLLTAVLDEVRALREELEDAVVPIEYRIVDLQRHVDALHALADLARQPVSPSTNGNGAGPDRGRLRRLLRLA